MTQPGTRGAKKSEITQVKEEEEEEDKQGTREGKKGNEDRRKRGVDVNGTRRKDKRERKQSTTEKDNRR